MLRTRAPLDPKVSFDLHVLGMPPAFVLSQDQTLKFMTEYKARTPPKTGETRTKHPFKEPFNSCTLQMVCKDR